jgi:NADH-quinone oxidoreductase subunit K
VGQLFALFVIAAAAAESVLGLAIILAIYRRRLVVNADEMDLMKN